MPAKTWVVFGDFNVIKDVSERSDFFAGMANDSSTHDFLGCLPETGLVDYQELELFSHGITKERKDSKLKSLIGF